MFFSGLSRSVGFGGSDGYSVGDIVCGAGVHVDGIVGEIVSELAGELVGEIGEIVGGVTCWRVRWSVSIDMCWWILSGNTACCGCSQRVAGRESLVLSNPVALVR